jgi:uncharacterized repeat protein (TIGR03803 family)
MPYDLAGSRSGTIYGVVYQGGNYTLGAVFELKLRRDGSWRYKIIHSFQGSEGYNPVGLILDQQTGTLYGTTQNGGSSNFGTVFKLVRNGAVWDETVLHSFFGGGDGANPKIRPTLDTKTGTLYGVTASGGIYGNGAVYMLSP